MPQILHSAQKYFIFVKSHYFSTKHQEVCAAGCQFLRPFWGTVQVFWPLCLVVCCVTLLSSCGSSVVGVVCWCSLVGWVVCGCTLAVMRSVLCGYSGGTLGVLCQYSGSTAPVLWQYCTSTLGLPWVYCASTLGVLCKYWPSPLLGHHTHQQFQQVPSFDNHTAGHTYTKQVCSAKYCRIAFLKIWIFKNLILSIFKKIKGSKNAA